jgi:hypothetical protein
MYDGPIRFLLQLGLSSSYHAPNGDVILDIFPQRLQILVFGLLIPSVHFGWDTCSLRSTKTLARAAY